MKFLLTLKKAWQTLRASRLFKTYRKGISMIEILGALAIGALVIGGGVVLFNTAADRAEGANIAQSLQGFIVDMNSYLKQNYRDTWTVAPGEIINEGHLQNDIVAEASRKDFRNTGTGDLSSIPQFPAANTSLGVDADNLNMLRFINLPSVRYFESQAQNDPDAQPEWTLYVNETTTYDMAFALTPMALGAAVATSNGAGTADTEQFVTGTNPTTMNTIGQITSGAAAANGTGCPAPADASIPDTAAVVAISLSDIDICQQVANRIDRFEHVLESWCLDADTSPGTFASVAAADSAANFTQGDATLHICFGVQN